MNCALDYIIPSDVEIKLDSSNNLLIDMSGDDEAGETLSIDLPESFYEIYRDESGEVNLQEMWAAVYNGIVDAIRYDLADIEDEQESLSVTPRFPERGRNNL